MLSEKDIWEYAEINGFAAAADLLILNGPNEFAGNYDQLLCDLENSEKQELSMLKIMEDPEC